MLLLSDLGLNIVRQVVSVVAREDDAARHGRVGLGRVHLLDVVLVAGVDDGRDVEVGLALGAGELDLAEHAGGVLLALGDGVEVADVALGEVDGGLLRRVDGDGIHGPAVLVGSKVDGATDVIESPEGDLASRGQGGGAESGENGGGELHLEGFQKVCEDWLRQGVLRVLRDVKVVLVLKRRCVNGA